MQTPIPIIANAGNAATMFSMNGNWRVMGAVGLPLNPRPTNPTVNPPGLGTAAPVTGLTYNHRGHVIGNRFFGPNGDPRNIVAMHRTSNLSLMPRVQNQIERAIINSGGGVFRIEAQPVPARPRPPDKIEVQLPAGLPAAGRPGRHARPGRQRLTAQRLACVRPCFAAPSAWPRRRRRR